MYSTSNIILTILFKTLMLCEIVILYKLYIAHTMMQNSMDYYNFIRIPFCKLTFIIFYLGCLFLWQNVWQYHPMTFKPTFFIIHSSYSFVEKCEYLRSYSSIHTGGFFKNTLYSCQLCWVFCSRLIILMVCFLCKVWPCESYNSK